MKTASEQRQWAFRRLRAKREAFMKSVRSLPIEARAQLMDARVISRAMDVASAARVAGRAAERWAQERRGGGK